MDGDRERGTGHLQMRLAEHDGRNPRKSFGSHPCVAQWAMEEKDCDALENLPVER